MWDLKHLPSFVDQLPKNGKGKVALFDADGTLWRDDVADDFTKHAIDSGVLKEGHLWSQYLKIYAENPPEGCRFLLNLYKGVLHDQVKTSAQKWWSGQRNRNWVVEVMAALGELHQRGYEIWVVTASPTDLIAPIMDFLPVDRVIGIDFEVDSEGHLTGAHSGILCAHHGKAEKVNHLLKSQSLEICFSAGNSMMDIPMIEVSRVIRWAVYPNEEFHREADLRGYEILRRPQDFVEEQKFSHSHSEE